MKELTPEYTQGVKKLQEFYKDKNMEYKIINNVEMRHVKEVGEFIKKVESAHESAANSSLRFKGNNLTSVFSN